MKTIVLLMRYRHNFTFYVAADPFFFFAKMMNTKSAFRLDMKFNLTLNYSLRLDLWSVYAARVYFFPHS